MSTESLATYHFLIGTTDDFSTQESLIQAFLNGNPNGLNMSSFTFDLPEIEGFDMYETARVYGQGLAFESDWCQDDTISFFFRSR